jgi:predicted transport protein
VYEAFKWHARRPEVANAGVDALVADIHDFARYFCAMAMDKEKDKKLSIAFNDLRELKVDVAYPFLLELYDDYQKGILSRDDFHDAVRLIESYVFRRAVCAVPPNSLNNTFATFKRALRKDRYLESIKAHLLGLRSNRRFPNDEEFKRHLSERDLYNFRSRRYWLRRLENFRRKEWVSVDDYTIEHILPQNENLPIKWREVLGDEWQRIQETWLHTLGNLTLTGYNSEYSDRPFSEKRDMQYGFKQSPLRLNEGLGAVATWNEKAIQNRAEKLSSQAIQVWAAPLLSDDVLETYRKVPAKQETYSLDDHPQLAEGKPMHRLFEQLRKEVLALDPCVTEEVLKLYIAFKAETNFVDVVPQKTCLKLFLNLEFHELSDTKGIAKDVTNLGRWGNGDVEISLTDLSELPYVMELVRQSFEAQLEN